MTVRPVAGLCTAIAVLCALLSLPSNAGASDAVSSSQAIGWLNAQRAANGIPAGIVDNPAWDAGCAHHVAWDRAHPHAANPHLEEPGTSGYTEDGAWAGSNSVLGGGFTPSKRFPWGAVNGWETAPIHLMQLLAPALSESGFSSGCMVTLGGWIRPGPSAPELLTYPGDRTTFLYPTERAGEWPFTPGAFVGLKEGSVTGPYLYLLAWGSGAGRILSASLIGPAGPVELRTIDNETVGLLGNLGSYLPPGGMLIPVRPLVAGATYHAAVTFAPTRGFGPSVEQCVTAASSTSCTYGPPPPGPPASKEWTFATAINENSLTLSLYTGRSKHHKVRFVVIETQAPAVHVALRSTTGSIVAPKLRRVAIVQGTNPHSVFEGTLRLPHGSWIICATSGGGNTGYVHSEKCQRLR